MCEKTNGRNGRRYKERAVSAPFGLSAVILYTVPSQPFSIDVDAAYESRHNSQVSSISYDYIV